MRLSVLLNQQGLLPQSADLDIQSISSDSRKVQKNSVFIAVKGTQQDGNKYIEDAIARGAHAIFTEASDHENVEYRNGIPLIAINNLSQKIGEIAARFYDFPSKKMRMIGVTGTNGKTSCTHFLAEILSNLNHRCGLIGTLGSGFYGDLKETGLTTPDAITLQESLHQFVQQQTKVIAMEVSSHSIHQGRINAIDFDVGIFTNLTQDHLDYHGNMENYAKVKRSFFTDYPINNLIINADDLHGVMWLNELSHASMFAYSLQPKKFKHIPLIFADDIVSTDQGIHAKIHSPWGNAHLTLPLVGEFNLSNALSVLTTLCQLDVPFDIAIQQLSHVHSVPGRMEMIKAEHHPLVIVDYSHTPDALQKALIAARAHTQSKLICVFGCGGDRDQSKRPMMASIAEKWADEVIVTSDNPRHESPDVIAQQIFTGFQQPNRILLELDRAKAIKNSIQLAKPNDCILIAGKGAERYQQIGDKKFPFDDREEVQKNFGIKEKI